MMCLLVLYVVFTCFGTTRGRESNFIDTNRIRLVPKETEDLYTYKSIIDRSLRSPIDYDDHSSWKDKSGGPRLLQTSYASSVPVKVHQPKQDPRLFYQSDSYLKEVKQKDLDRDVTYIYPGREMIRSNEIRSTKTCIKCPHDMTLVAKPGLDRVVFQHPRLYTCSGRKAHRHARFVQMYGPKFGTLVQEGSHMIIGRLTYKGKSLHLCKIQAHVMLQGCTTPKHLISHCGQNQRCNFTCRNPKLEIQGLSSLTCDNHNWSGALPDCKERTWCDPPLPPDHGHVTCKSMPAGATGMLEGSRCRVKCARGWHRPSRAFSVCRRGAWTNTLSCISNRIRS